jgi:hypothetical protein
MHSRCRPSKSLIKEKNIEIPKNLSENFILAVIENRAVGQKQLIKNNPFDKTSK